MISGGKFHKSKHEKNSNYSVTLLSICQPLVPWLQEKGETSPFKTGKFGSYFVNIHILVLVYVEYCQRGQPLLTHSAWKRGFQSFHAAKTVFGSAG